MDGQNPIEDALVPREARAGKETHATSTEDVAKMLTVFETLSRTAVSGAWGALKLCAVCLKAKKRAHGQRA